METTPDNADRKIKVRVTSDGEFVFIGIGRNPDYPRLEIPVDDVEDVIFLLRKAVTSKLPSQP